MPFPKDPTSKADLIDRILSQAFNGDFKEVSADPSKVTVTRIKPHVISIMIAGKEFLLAAHKPKPEKAIVAARKAYHARMERLLKGKRGAAPKVANQPVLPPGEARGGLGRYAPMPPPRKKPSKSKPDGRHR